MLYNNVDTERENRGLKKWMDNCVLHIIVDHRNVENTIKLFRPCYPLSLILLSNLFEIRDR